MISDALKRFHDEFCRELSYDDPKLTFLLIEKVNEMRKESDVTKYPIELDNEVE
jgi:hypothetical protein